MIWISLSLLTSQISVLFFSTKIFILLIIVTAIVFTFLSLRAERSFAFFLLILLAFAACGRLLGYTALRSDLVLLPRADSSSPCMCDGFLKGDPAPSTAGWRMDVRLVSCAENISGKMQSAGGTVRIFTPELIESLGSGDEVRMLVRIKEPRAFKNPGSFDHPLYLRTQGIDATGSLAGPKWIVRTASAKKGVLSGAIEAARKRIDSAISATSEGDTAGVLKALTIGGRYEISDATREVFSRTGLAHILSISGLHVGFIAMIVFLILRILLIWLPHAGISMPMQRICAVASIPLIWLYVAIANFPVPAVRAGIMITIFLVALFFMWRRDLLSALAAAVFAILIIMPSSAFSVSFQLSVVSVFAIIVLTPVLSAKLGRFKRAGRLFDVMVVTLAATLGSAPLVAYYFFFVSGVGLLANVVAVPYSGVLLMPLVMASIPMSLVHTPLALHIWKAAAFCADGLIGFAGILSAYGGPLVLSWAPSRIEVLLAYAVIAAIVFRDRLPYKKAVAAALGAALIFDAGYWHLGHHMTGRLEVRFLDVGQGDSIVVRFPDGHVTLIDGGGIKGSEFDVGRNVVVPALLRMGIRSIDDIILTHPHHDHYKGLAYIAEKLRPEVIYTNGTDAPEDEAADWEDFLERVKRADVPLRTLNGAGDGRPALTVEHGGARLEVFAQPAKDLKILDPNDGSLVTRIVHGERSVLLTGDLMDMGERMLLEEGAGLSSDVMKVGHHGSDTATSAALLAAIRPEIAVITVGENNQYGVPDESVINALKNAGAEIYRTDRDGAVTISTDGRTIEVDTFVPRHF